VDRDDTEAAPSSDERVIGLCLRAVVDLPAFQDWEFQTLFGLDRSGVEQVALAWPSLPPSTPPGFDSPEDAQHTAVNNALNNLLGYPHGLARDEFERVVGVDAETVAATFRRWRSDRP
jgi:hypothetical protein